MLRYRADFRTLGFVTTYFILVAAGFLLPAGHPFLRTGLVVATCLFSFFCAVITHNTIHAPIFYRRWPNKIFQVVLSLCYGHPVSAFVPGHNLSHHKWTQSTRDIMRTTKVRFRWNLLNQLFFTSVVSKSIMASELGYAAAMRKARPRWFRQLIGEAIVLFGTMGILLFLNWKLFLLHVIIPHLYAAWGIVGINFVQHDGCDPEHAFNHSRNFVGRWVNWWTFNNGFHGIHHEHPTLHWSVLPENHSRELHPGIHPSLEQVALLPYVYRAYVSPGERLTYDGKAIELAPVGDDESWWQGNVLDFSTADTLGAEI